jgi:NTE family protein
MRLAVKPGVRASSAIPGLLPPFYTPEGGRQRPAGDYAALPGRPEPAAAMLMPFRKKLLPNAPSAVAVL